LDHVLKCNYYNQGCEGGYSYLLGKFYKEFEVIPGDCYARAYCGNVCKDLGYKKGKLNIKVSEYYYVGDYYGYSNENNLYEELKENGPITISLSPNYLFQTYRSGIFDGDNETFRKLKLKEPEWQRVDHSVVLVGYGVENDIEYWLLQNSWGISFGEYGYMKVRKGKNLMNIESLGEAIKATITED